MPRQLFVAVVFAATCFPTAVAGDVDSNATVADAAERRDRAVVRSLIQSDVDLDAAQADGMTALHWSVYHDDVKLTRMLLGAGANVARENRYGVQPLSIACQNGNGVIVRLLLEAGADPNATLHGGETVLMTASRTGRVGPVTALLEAGAEVDARDRSGQTAVMWAAAEGYADVVQTLITAGADFQTPLKSGFTPLLFAVREGHTDVVFELADAGAAMDEPIKPQRGGGKGLRRGTTPLMLAVENGHFELAAALLDAGADPNGDATGFTPLHAMTWVRKPLRGDGDPPPVGSGRMGSLDFVRKLVASGADVNARHGKQGASNGRLNRTDATPFLLAAETGDVPLLQLLLEFGADPTLKNADDCTPLLAAAGVGVLGNGDESAGTEEDAIAAVSLLLELGADINAVDSHGKTAMHGAAFKSWTKLVAFLADNGADVDVWNRKNSRGWTPLMIAQGHRPGNFRPSQETIAAVERAMRASGVEPPK